MEKLNKVIRALECCVSEADCDLFCPYWDESEDSDETACGLMRNDALDQLKGLKTRLELLRVELAEERDRSARWLRESEPVVHAHWISMKQIVYPSRHNCYCSACGQHGHFDYGRCPGCGAHMDEEVSE